LTINRLPGAEEAATAANAASTCAGVR
jgi:hypothetical protein